MKGRKNRRLVVITAGSTREYLDPVRYLTNASSGEMGIEIARAVRTPQNSPVLVSGNLSALQMSAQIHRLRSKCDVFVAAAAVSDWRFKNISRHKLKKGSKKTMTLQMVRNPDILAEVGAWKRKTKREKPVLIGFALETQNLQAAMKRKLREKNLDLIIGNSPSSFGSKFIKAFWLERNSTVKSLGRITKRELARRLARWINQHG